jgi:hypothetical protein
MAFSLPAPPAGPATREAIARYVSDHLAPCSARTVEKWPLTYRLLNGRAVAEWPDVLALLRERYERAPVHRGGHRRAA